MVCHSLIIGYGNLDRADDGVAYWIVNAVRRRLGQPDLGEYVTGLDELGADVDSIFLTQLAPELAEELVGYERIVFVDAHVLENVAGLYRAPVIAEYAPATFTHHLTPSNLLALLRALYHVEPTGYIISVRGWNFDFGRDLSPGTAALVEPAAERILQWLGCQP